MGNKQLSYPIYEPLVDKDRELAFKIAKGDRQSLFLHRSIGAITWVDQQKGLQSGSGVLLSKDTVLTSAQNVYNKSQKRLNTELKFYLMQNEGVKDHFSVQNIKFLEQYISCKQQSQLTLDFALLKIAKKSKLLSEEIKYEQFPRLSIPCQICLMKNNKKNLLRTFGYPTHSYQNNGIHQDQSPQDLKLYQYSGKIGFIRPYEKKISYQMKVSAGISGSPIVFRNQIIAIHNYRLNQGQRLGFGRIVDLFLINQLQDWCQQINGHPFSIYDNDLCPHLSLIVQSYLRYRQGRKSRQSRQIIMPSKRLKQINVKEHTNLTHLNLQNNLLLTIDVTKNVNLTHLYLSNNNLSSIDITNNTNLEELYLKNNQLCTIDVSSNTKLTYLYLQNNRFSELDVTTNISLIQLWAYNNQLTAVNVIKNINLTVLYLSNNRISSIDTSENIKLAVLYLYNNQLSEIDLRKNINLIDLNLSFNNLTTIDVTNSRKLAKLFLFNNKLSEINLINNANLDKLQLYSNQLKTIFIPFISKPMQYYLGSKFNISDQLSDICEIQIRYYKEGKFFIKQLQKLLKAKYSDKQYNEHRCKYVFTSSDKL